ncbi:hypothetical protein BDV96DRAFT_490563 [Lophiotrema nucula]|uniref:Uncharacterized protein n=1 Tax=Lophiotrema nucula TaxID=690887 RepID=A0A6A5ZD42_9PLEO|nr:hypothetical protein BDV96DRAFT_490563 [Lophiotrema nucula]
MLEASAAFLRALQERFRLDALGLVTLLGADNLRDTYGRLESPEFAIEDYFPTLASHVAFDDSILKPLPGFTLYNISDGIKATDLSAWFTRWLSTQKFTECSTTLRIEANSIGANRKPIGGLSFPPAFIIVFLFLGLGTILTGDSIGVLCVWSLLIASICRANIVDNCRATLEDHAMNANPPGTKSDPAKILVTLPSGQVVRIKTTKGIAMDCLLTEAKPKYPQDHMFQRIVGWLVFIIHALTLGMCTLPAQIFILGALAFFTALVSFRTRSSQHGTQHRISDHLHITRLDTTGRDTRAKMFARLELTHKEEQNLVVWFIMPRRSNEVWWNTFKTFKEEAKADASVLDTWGARLAAAYEANKAREELAQALMVE